MLAPVRGAVQGVDRESAREAARSELSKPVYRESEPTPLERALAWLADRVVDAFDAVTSLGVAARTGLLVALLLLATLVVAVRLRTGPLARRAALGATPGARRLGPADHRRLADALAAQGRYAEAVRERMRAVVRELEQQGLLVPRVGLTAGEVATEAGALAPGLAGDLRDAAALFDEVWYGGRQATAVTAERLAEVDQYVRSSRRRAAAPVGAEAPGTDTAVSAR
jgi:hypothetical protein